MKALVDASQLSRFELTRLIKLADPDTITRIKLNDSITLALSISIMWRCKLAVFEYAKVCFVQSIMEDIWGGIDF
ncbi:conserved protein of unknown function [Shewanella benthica]|uniref:Uncharacterized protein n=1 Tax=Shewanella benthica TaxID=43661 RepID=A0A330M1U3_9GAMM|nr:conserved protein of unknown function [Shewanella benthica]